MTGPLFAGIDAGTSGLRLCLIDAKGRIRHQDRHPLPEPDSPQPGWHEQDPLIWREALHALLTRIPDRLKARLAALAIDGTSGTVLVCDEQGEPLHPALMYHDRRAVPQAEEVARQAPPDSPARGAQSATARLLWLMQRLDHGRIAHVLHQAEWLSGQLLGRFDQGDENNALKLGYDPVQRRWPDWLQALGIPRSWLPQVQPPGTPLGPVSAEAARVLGLPPELLVVSGTTDSIAAFLASGAQAAGDGVTSLGSTLAIKLLCDRPVQSPEYGIYSHRLWDQWLAGGASNSGGRVLRHFFTDRQLEQLTACLDPDHPTGLDYWPLLEPGERFPVADPQLPPRMTPRPDDDCRFLQALLEGMARIEAEGYRLLASLGAPAVRRVFTAGGGARNPAWRRIRQRLLQVPVMPARCEEAACGTAQLAARGIMGHLPAIGETTE
ncbi:MAG: carbohydrate kinase [Gammaproteobacteria bacterium]|nr:MAG: carbohydrate kinase [Gammaproteobacteria bacterium]